MKICFGLTNSFYCIYTRPHLDTVAGVVFYKSSVSNKIDIPFERLIDSPLAKLSFLLSSSIEFRFSTQEWSTGPSRISHFFLLVESKEYSL